VRFLVRLQNHGKFKSSDARSLVRSCYEVVREYGADVGNLSVSSTAVELDLLLESKGALEDSTRALEGKLGPVLTVRELDTKTPQVEVDRAIREGIELFNEERYWESHESLEAAWRQTEGPEKELLQGVILIAAALVHLQKNDGTVALSVMRRAEEKLSRHHGESFGIDIDRLHQNLSKMIADGRLWFFKIQPNP